MVKSKDDDAFTDIKTTLDIGGCVMMFTHKGRRVAVCGFDPLDTIKSAREAGYLEHEDYNPDPTEVC